MSPIAHITRSATVETTALTAALSEAFEHALGEAAPLPPLVTGMEGMSGQRYRRFINRLIASLPRAAYLEVGSWTGSTLCAAVHGNRLRAFAIDNWSMYGGPLQAFLRNLSECDCTGADLNFLTADFRQVDYTALGTFNVYLFDGPHEHADQHDGLVLAAPALAEEFVFLVDDWNWPAVRNGTAEAVAALGLNVLAGIEVRTTLDGSHPVVARQHSDWHNGYWLAVLRKPARLQRV